MNFFADQGAAARYAAARPYFHPLAVERLRTVLGAAVPVRLAVDLGCGTGQSAVALAEVAATIVGIDSAAEMLSVAQPHPKVRYLHAPAERVPLADGGANLLTVGSAFHWFDREPFLREAARLIVRGGWLAIYNDGFVGEMQGNTGYGQWNRGHYVARFPTPARNSSPFTDAQAETHGFTRCLDDAFLHDIAFTPAQLAAYLSTQTNVLAAIAAGRESADSALAWLAAAVTPHFLETPASFPFRCRIEVFRRT